MELSVKWNILRLFFYKVVADLCNDKNAFILGQFDNQKRGHVFFFISQHKECSALTQGTTIISLSFHFFRNQNFTQKSK